MANGLLIPTANRSAYQTGTGNNFVGPHKEYINQCTWWASQRYHDLTGIWVPWSGDAWMWANGAKNANWQVQAFPPQGIPSIICLQGYAGQGLEYSADGMRYGHVGVVESVNSDGSVQTSNFNWSPHIKDRVVVYHRFVPGNGVSFIYASNSAVSSSRNSIIGTLGSIASQVSIAPNADVTQFLFDVDQALQFTNPFIPPDFSDFFNPIAYLEAVSAQLWQDTTALIWRTIFLFLGFFLLYKVLSHFIDFAGIAQQTGGAVAQILPYLA